MLCECLINGIYTMSCYVNVVYLGKKIAPRCSGKFWKFFYSVQNWNKNEKE